MESVWSSYRRGEYSIGGSLYYLVVFVQAGERCHQHSSSVETQSLHIVGVPLVTSIYSVRSRRLRYTVGNHSRVFAALCLWWSYGRLYSVTGFLLSRQVFSFIGPWFVCSSDQRSHRHSVDTVRVIIFYPTEVLIL